MIKKVIMKNFQSHEDTVIQFGDKLNLIVGMSNSGKSSIIRALSCCVANRWQKEQVRTGFTYCQVEVHTEKGYVRCQRGQGINRWVVYDGTEQKQYKSIGTNVPQEVPYILGMGQRNRGDIKQMPNFMFQLQKHYMLSQIDGKKATSNLIARMMDNAIGLGGMQDLIKNIASDLTKDKRKLTELTSSISQKKSKIIDEKIFQGYEKLVQDCLRKKQQLADIFSMLEKTQKLYDEFSNKKTQMENIEKNKIQIDIDETFGELRQIQNRYLLIEEYKKLSEKQSKLSSFEDIELQKYFEESKQIEQIYSKYLTLKKKREEYENKRKRLVLLNMSIKRDQKQYQQSENRINQIKKELGYCPLCGKEF